MKKFLAVSAALLFLCVYAEARKVSGIVKSGDKVLPGVIVTDGKNFTKTKNTGKFTLKIRNDAEFVYIVSPSGYVADWSSGVPAFYQEAAGKDSFTFDLLPLGDSDDYSIIAMSDPQFRSGKDLVTFSEKPMDDLCETIRSLKGTKVGIALGDISYDSPDLLKIYKKEILRTKIPFYPVAGNHDHDKTQKGDLKTISVYRRMMGPENYAFYLGKDVVIVLDNIIYDTEGQYTDGYAKHVLSWLKGLEALLPDKAELYIAQHCPLMNEGFKIENASELLDIVRGRKVTFLSGHTHMNNNFQYEENMVEHNIASICGAWWDATRCTDGTPQGYKVFSKKFGELQWYYKAIGHPKDHQAEICRLGQAPLHPNSVVANVWDWDPSWTVEWYEDGEYKGRLKPVIEYSSEYVREINGFYEGKRVPSYERANMSSHFFAATPGQYAKYVTIAIENPFGRVWTHDVKVSDFVDVQAHRGGAGLMPENTIEAMRYALDMGVNTLELDLQISADGQVVVSHDHYFHYRYAIRPDGSHVQKGEPKEYIYTMPYSEVKKYDVGSRKSERWPEKACIRSAKPLASELIDFVEKYTAEMGYSPVRYNIEIKSEAGKGEGENWPTYDKFVTLCCKLLHSKHLGDRLVIQSFDHRALNYMHEKYPEFVASYLVDDKAQNLEKYLSKLDFTPQWFSPHYSLVDEKLVKECHEKGIRIVPWTADDPEEIKRLIDLKVDAIISNYPDRVLLQTRGFVFAE